MNIFQESFDYGACRFIASSGTMVVSAGNGRRSTSSLHGTGYGYVPIVPSGDIVTVGVAVNPGILFTSGKERLLAIGNANGEQCYIRHELTGSLSVYRGTTLLGATAPNALPYGAYGQIEAQIQLANSATVELRVAGVGTVLSLTGVDTLDTGSAPATRLYLFPLGQRHFDDVFVNDTRGASNSGFLGDMRIDAHFPASDVSIEWTRSAGSSSFDNVNEQAPNDDSDYNFSLASGIQDHYGMQALIPRLAGIRAVSLLQRARKEIPPAGDAHIRGSVRIAGVNYPQEPLFALASGYDYYECIVENDPSTSSAFTDSGFESASWGPDRVS